MTDVPKPNKTPIALDKRPGCVTRITVTIQHKHFVHHDKMRKFNYGQQCPIAQSLWEITGLYYVVGSDAVYRILRMSKGGTGRPRVSYPVPLTKEAKAFISVLDRGKHPENCVFPIDCEVLVDGQV